MNSLLEKEGMAGKVQMVYIDPPYGIRYGSNFQPFVNRRDVKDGKDEDLTQEPEMIRAFRDTWELGHSFLPNCISATALLLARELLHESGSHASSRSATTNVHLVREVAGRGLWAKNFMRPSSRLQRQQPTTRSLDACDVRTTSFGTRKTRPREIPFALSGARRLAALAGRSYGRVELPTALARTMAIAERMDRGRSCRSDARVFRLDNLTSAASAARGKALATIQLKWAAATYLPSSKREWKTNRRGHGRLSHGEPRSD